VAWAIAIVAVLAACEPAKPRAPLEPLPEELLASVAIGPADTLNGLRAYLDAVQPGVSSFLSDDKVRAGLGELVGASSLTGLDPKSWSYVLVANVEGKPAFALLGKVTDAKSFQASAGSTPTMLAGGWATIGAKPVLDRIGRYALATIATQPAPTRMAATVWLPHVIAQYARELGEVRTQMIAGFEQAGTASMRQFMTTYLDGLGSMSRELDKLVITLDVTSALATLEFALTARPGTRFATFVAAQRPTDYALLDRLPVTAASMLFVGHVEAGPYRDGIATMMAAMLAPGTSQESLAALKTFGSQLTGDLAATFQITPGSGMAFTQLYGLTDAPAADQALATIFRNFEAGHAVFDADLGTRFKANPETSSYDGVTLRSYDTITDLSKLPAAQRAAVERVTPGGEQRSYVAVFDKLGLLVLGPDGVAEAHRSIDAARGKAARYVPSAPFATLLAASKAQKDSMAMMIDLGGFLSGLMGRAAPTGAPVAAPTVISFGFADRDARVRVAVPSATAAALRATMAQAAP
jgi:hypothetical protein